VSPPGHFRRFISREEIIKRLENYLEELKAEETGVLERIAELKGQGGKGQINETEAE
jgi:hypothetical protein